MNTKKYVHICIFIGLALLSVGRPTSAQLAETRENVIGVGDQLNIKVWGVPELSSQVSVRLDGKITMPLLGDIQAAGLKLSSLKAYLEGEEEDGQKTVRSYKKEPNIDISVVRLSETIQVTISGVVSQMLTVPRPTQVGQILKQLLQTLPAEPPPQVRNIVVTSAEGETFSVNWDELRSGQAPNMNVRLEWGDDIRIPAGASPEPIATPDAAPVEPPKVSHTAEALQLLLHEHPAEALETVLAMATSVEEGVYTFDLAQVSDEQQAALGDDIIRIVFYGGVAPAPRAFTNAVLLGIGVNLTLDETLEAYLALPGESSEALPIVRPLREGDLIEKGLSEDEDVYLEEILDEEMKVIVKQGDLDNELPLVPASPLIDNVTLAGIYTFRDGPKALFSQLPKRESRKPRQRMFPEGEDLTEDVTIAQISSQWVMLQKGEEIQLLLLRDSLSRPRHETETPPPPDPAGPGIVEEGALQVPQDMLQNALPDELKALNTFSELFFATPIF